MAEKKVIMELAGSFLNDLNILDLHESVVNYIRKMNEVNRVYYMKKLSTTLTKEESEKFNEELAKIERSDNLREYCEISKPFLMSYNELKPTTRSIVFSRKKAAPAKEEKVNKEKISHRIWVIQEYLEVASKFAPVNYVCLNEPELAGCACCGVTLTGSLVCENCFLVQTSEVVPEPEPPSIVVRPGAIWQNARKAFEEISKTYEFKVNESDLKEFVEKISAIMSSQNIKLTGKYLVFKAEQSIVKNIAPEKLGLTVGRAKLGEYDKKYSKICRQTGITYMDSF